MSADVDGIAGIGEMLHETWAQIIEVIVGIGLLALQVGWVSPLPLLLIYRVSLNIIFWNILNPLVCSHVSRFVAQRLRPYQKLWNAATQARITATTSTISGMKAVKMLGLQERQARLLQQYRIEELKVASSLRWIMVYYNASGL